MSGQDFSQTLCLQVVDAYSANKKLVIQGSNSKDFYGNQIEGEVLDVKAHHGIVDYEPTELFITARCGTSVKEIETVLAEKNQILPFEPPRFGEIATIGGTIACGFSGPRRPYASAARDCILGTHIINGKGEYLKFGGQVMKNVAGYDVSRVMCGALGTLGVIAQVSLKVIPKPEAEITLAIECKLEPAIEHISAWLHASLPLTATYFEAGVLYIRAAGIDRTVTKIKQTIGGTQIKDSDSFWLAVKEQQRNFFCSDTNLWRCNVPANSPALDINGSYIVEWNGGLRWYTSEDPMEKVIRVTQAARGHATLFRTSSKQTQRFTEINSTLKTLHKNLKQAFDPENILNPGKMYSWL